MPSPLPLFSYIGSCFVAKSNPPVCSPEAANGAIGFPRKEAVILLEDIIFPGEEITSVTTYLVICCFLEQLGRKKDFSLEHLIFSGATIFLRKR